jgi:hypothetical protein
MRQHQAVLLEEPETPGFGKMLTGEMSIDDYLRDADFEFMEFSRHSCNLFQNLYRRGTRLFQVDPFIDRLNEIHELFATGGKPRDIRPDSTRGQVYAAERGWSAALIAYYENCLIAPFAKVVELVKQFAREDAARGLLRDKLRAQAIRAIAPSFSTLYVEAGTLHIPLLNQLANRLPAGSHLRPVYLLAPVLRRLCQRRQTLGPGDKLTLRYCYRPDYTGPQADLLAARSLIHAKILIKREIVGAPGEVPHAHNETLANALVDDLSFSACEKLYALIKYKSTEEAAAIARQYAAQRNM